MYYNRSKINKKPLSKELVRELMQSDVLTKKINDAETGRRFAVERYLFELMKADCSLAVGVHAVICGDDLRVYGLFEGRICVKSGRYSDYRTLCRQIADEIYRQQAR